MEFRLTQLAIASPSASLISAVPTGEELKRLSSL
jgi:hypothetical protein